MKFLIKKEDLARAVQRVQSTAGKKDSTPLLSGILLEAFTGGLRASATDLEVYTQSVCAAEVEKKGAVAVNAKKLLEIAKDLPAEEVSVESDKDNRVTIAAARARFKLPGLAAEDFPPAPEIKDSAMERMDGEFLRGLIDKTYFAVSTDEHKYNINGFYLERGEGFTRMAATDGHRLAFVERPGRAGDTQAAILPRKGVLEMRRLLGEVEGEVLFGLDKKRAALMAGGAVISIRLIEGEFPDYRKVVPKDNDRVLLASKADILSALRRGAILTDKGHSVKLGINGNTLTVSSSCPEYGEASEEMDIEYSGPEMEAAYNSAYLIDAIEAVDSARVRLFFKDALDPVIIRPNGSDDYTGVIMPMRL